MQSSVERRFQDDVLRTDGVKQLALAFGVINPYQFLVQCNGDRCFLAQFTYLFPLSGTDGLFDGMQVELA